MVNANIILVAVLAFGPFFLGSDPAFAKRMCGGEEATDMQGWSQDNYIKTNTRVLERDADGPIETVPANRNGYRVSRGTWTDPFTGVYLLNIDTKFIEVDHIIPVCFAWQRGANTWSKEKRRAFYNDMDYLVATLSRQNGMKSDSPPWEFLPRNRAFACEYVDLFREGVDKYGLFLSDDERRHLDATAFSACGRLDADQQS